MAKICRPGVLCTAMLYVISTGEVQSALYLCVRLHIHVTCRCLEALSDAEGGWPQYLLNVIASTPIENITEHGLFYRHVLPSRKLIMLSLFCKLCKHMQGASMVRARKVGMWEANAACYTHDMTVQSVSEFMKACLRPASIVTSATFIYHREPEDCHTYGKGRITLLGDAAHLTAAALGQGCATFLH